MVIHASVLSVTGVLTIDGIVSLVYEIANKIHY